MKKLTLLLLTVLCVSFYCNANESEPVSLPPDLIPVTLNGKASVLYNNEWRECIIATM